VKKQKRRTTLEDYAAKPVLIFSGSILVLSVALNNIGFKEVVDAYAKSIVYKLENKKACKIDNNQFELQFEKLNHRLEIVEGLAHKGGNKNATQETR